MGQYPSIHSDACIFSISFNKDVEPTSLEELNSAERDPPARPCVFESVEVHRD